MLPHPLPSCIHPRTSPWQPLKWNWSRSVIYDSLWPSWTVAYQAPLSLGILQARILEWVAMPFSRGSSQLRYQTQVSHIAGRLFILWGTREVWQPLTYPSFLILSFQDCYEWIHTVCSLWDWIFFFVKHNSLEAHSGMHQYFIPFYFSVVNIPWCRCTTVPTVQLLKDIWILFSFLRLWIELL